MEKNTDEVRTSSRQAIKGYRPNIKGKYEIFGALRDTDMTI